MPEPVYKEKFFRNLGAVSKNEQEKIYNATFAVVGLGGLGGIAIETLARAGAQRFILFDFDRVELTNFNRQLLATESSMDKMKTEAAEKRIKEINVNAKIKAWKEKFTAESAAKVKDADVVIDGSDNIETRIAVAKACRKLGIAHVFAAANNGCGMVSVIKPKSKTSFESMFQIKKGLSGYGACQSIFAPAAFLAGTLAASLALNVAMGKSIVEAPEVLFIDVFAKKNMFSVKKLG
jgi:molybdopterin/thiamine biosynthesis adenylyltransferase